MKFNIYFKFLVLFFLIIFTSCDHKENYLQEYDNYENFHNVKNQRLTGWFPIELIKKDAKKIKNESYLSTKCVFGVFDYNKEELYDSIFTVEANIDSLHYEIFFSQIKKVDNIIPEWFQNVDYWKMKRTGIILFDNCYAYRDSEKKQIYYFHPKEEDTFIDGKTYPGIRNTIR